MPFFLHIEKDAGRGKAPFPVLDVAKKAVFEKRNIGETLQATRDALKEAYEASWFAVPTVY